MTLNLSETKQVNPDDGLWFVTFMAAMLLVIAMMLDTGCGASAETRGAYALEQARCVANEREIVARQGTTASQDYADLELERARCDHALRVIEENPE